MADDTPCPVAPLAAEMARLVAAWGRLDEDTAGMAVGPARSRALSRLEAVERRMEAVEALAVRHRVGSAEGLLLQLCVASALADRLEAAADPAHRGDAPGWGEALQACLYSAASFVERQSGVMREAVGGGHYLDREFDPHGLLDEALAEGGA